MQDSKNPILNFRKISEDNFLSSEEFYNLNLGNQANSTKFCGKDLSILNTSTMITLTREAADSSEHSE
jgi:hypothetical protein